MHGTVGSFAHLKTQIFRPERGQVAAHADLVQSRGTSHTLSRHTHTKQKLQNMSLSHHNSSHSRRSSLDNSIAAAMEGFKSEMDDYRSVALILDDEFEDVVPLEDLVDPVLCGDDGDDDFSEDDDDCPAPDNFTDVKRHLLLLSSSSNSGCTDEIESYQEASSSMTKPARATAAPTKVAHAPTLAPTSTVKKVAGGSVMKKGGEIDFEKVLTLKQRQEIPIPKLNPKRNPRRPLCLFINYLGTRRPPTPPPVVMPEPTPVPTRTATKKGFSATVSSKPSDPPVVSPEPRKRSFARTKHVPPISAIAATEVYHASYPTPLGSFPSSDFLSMDGPKLKRTRGKEAIRFCGRIFFAILCEIMSLTFSYPSFTVS